MVVYTVTSYHLSLPAHHSEDKDRKQVQERGHCLEITDRAKVGQPALPRLGGHSGHHTPLHPTTPSPHYPITPTAPSSHHPIILSPHHPYHPADRAKVFAAVVLVCLLLYLISNGSPFS